jgi:tetratricopeptide (TPR) repeat protein
VKAKAKVPKSGSKKKEALGVAPNRKPPAASAEAKAEEARFAQALQGYEQAVKAMQAQRFDKAKPLLEKVIDSGPRSLVDRAKVHLSICEQQLTRKQKVFNTPEEHYDYAVSLMNMGDFVGAREHFEGLVKEKPKLDFVWYGLAVLNCLTGRTPESLENLATAIKLNPQNRYQARNDSDFRNMADDPRFTELLYPEGAESY